MKFQFTDGTTQRLKTPIYFCPSGKIGPHLHQIKAGPVGTTRRFFSSRMTAASP
jgi:hypothetical protein